MVGRLLMLREQIIEILAERYSGEGVDEWVSFDTLARGLNAKIADVMYETTALCDQRYAERTGHRGKDQIRLTEKGLLTCKKEQ
jgi:hypothetical protein